MKYFLIIATICSILVRDLYQFSWDVWFRMNQEEIAQQHCENKDKPVLKCDGKCYLAKQLKKAEVKLEQEQSDGSSAPVRPKVMNDAKIDRFAHLSFHFSAVEFRDIAQLSYAFITSNWTYSPISDIDHPPCYDLV